MLKYYNAMVVFEEIPDEITLAINITNCPCHCKGCHSKFLWEDVGDELTAEVIDELLKKHDGVTCVCFMGGDASPKDVNISAEYVKKDKGLKVGWYSGRDEISKEIDLKWFNYVKIGHYDDELGGLNRSTTNQILYEVLINNVGMIVLNDITSKFWD